MRKRLYAWPDILGWEIVVSWVGKVTEKQAWAKTSRTRSCRIRMMKECDRSKGPFASTMRFLHEGATLASRWSVLLGMNVFVSCYRKSQWNHSPTVLVQGLHPRGSVPAKKKRASH